ncbi:MAG TPA: hypothetical protein VLA24_17225 [Pseudomonadales bacterium]|nr:hypothetical protein [Pseudomonadales bacterium]
MVWLPVAFVCLTNNVCSFYNGDLSISLEQCEVQNQRAAIAMKTDADVQAYQVDCIEIKPKQTDSL